MADKMNGLLHFLNFIAKIGEDREIYNNIKNDAELRPFSKYFGWRAILQSVLFAVFSVGGAISLYVGFTRNLGIFLNIILIMLGIGLVLVSIELFFFALSRTIKQLKLNRRAISWIALVVFILCVVGAVAILSMAYNGMANAK
ncbi:MAG: hypothetical protein IJ542_04115 [Clostridia bacterium]|nr:hypothetical protein [Clostridia bacterium]